MSRSVNTVNKTGKDLLNDLQQQFKEFLKSRETQKSSDQSSLAELFSKTVNGYRTYTEIIQKGLRYTASDISQEAKDYYTNMICTLIDQMSFHLDRLSCYLNPQPLSLHKVSVNQLLENFKSTLQGILPEHYSLTVQLLEKERLVSIDPTQINKVLSILCSNALEAMPAGGELRVGAVKIESRQIGNSHRSCIQIFIQDSGSGIDPENEHSIFHPVFTTKRPEQLRGVGLAVARQIIQKHNGRMQLQTSKNVGTKVSILLPYSHCDQRDTKGNQTNESELTRSLDILGSEDDSELRRLISTILIQDN